MNHPFIYGAIYGQTVPLVLGHPRHIDPRFLTWASAGRVYLGLMVAHQSRLEVIGIDR